MLLLTRHVGEEIVVGEQGEIRIILLGLKDGRVRLGISAPSAIPVNRREIYDRIQEKKQNNKAA